MRFQVNRQIRCPRCYMHRSDCLCDEAPRLEGRTTLGILLHASELFKSTATGRLLPLAWRRSFLDVRGLAPGFQSEILEGLTSQVSPLGDLPDSPDTPLVLFPDEESEILTPDQGGEKPVLLVPDGNWNQAARMIHRVPLFRDARKVRLPGSPRPWFPMRNQSSPGRVSTFEAVSRALGILEGPEVEAKLRLFYEEMVGRYRRTLRPEGPGFSIASHRKKENSGRESVGLRGHSMQQSNRSVFRVEGGNPLSGKIRPQGNKNEALPLLAASILSAEPVTLENLPAIEDVLIMEDLLQELGAQVEEVETGDPTRIRITAKHTPASSLPPELSGKLRGSVTLAGPILARSGRVFLPRPGGDRIGRRRLDTHILALQSLGAKVNVFPDGFELQADRLRGADILLDEASVTATENVVAAATLAEGETTIRNAASEPHVQGLCRMLISMGAKIEGVGSNILRIQGVGSLHGTTHRIGSDYLEVGSFISLAAVTGGELLIEDAAVEDLRMIRLIFSRLGIETRVEGANLRVPADQSMEIVDDLGGAIPKIDDAPWPGFPADMTSVALVTATQCRGTILIHEKMFESRLYFTDHLIAMGAKIVLCDPHRAVIMGPAPLTGARVSSPDIRAGMAMLIAALAASGESEIHNINQIDRGFMNIDTRLGALGARIERI